MKTRLTLLLEPSALTAVHLAPRGSAHVVIAARRFAADADPAIVRTYLHDHPTRVRRAWVLLPDDEVVVRQVVLPRIGGERRERLLKQLVEHLAGGPYEHMAVRDLGAVPAGPGREALLAAWNGDRPFAARRRLEELGLEPAGVVPLSLALAGVGRPRGEPELLAWVGAEEAVLLLREGSALRFIHTSRRLPPPAWRFPIEAWTYPPLARLDPPQAPVESCRPFLEGLQRVCAYIAAEGLPRPRRVCLLGDLRPSPALDRWLSQSLGLPVARPARGTPHGAADLFAVFAALSRLVRTGRVLNLAPPQKRRLSLKPHHLLRPAFAAAVAGLFTWGALEHARLWLTWSALQAAPATPAAAPPKPEDPWAPARRHLTGSPWPHVLALLQEHAGRSLTLTKLRLYREAGQWVAFLDGVGQERAGANPAAELGSLLAAFEKQPWVAGIETAPWSLGKEFRFRCFVRIAAAARQEEEAAQGEELLPAEDALLEEGAR